MIDVAAATTNWWVEIGKGLIGAVIGFASAVAIERYKARDSAVRSGEPMGKLSVWIGLARMFVGQLRAPIDCSPFRA